MLGMEVNPFTQMIFYIFISSAILITMYTCNFYYLAYLSLRRNEKYYTVKSDAPTVTVHLPIYNEKYVASRLIDAVCSMEYPKEKMKVMVLDDSDDDTTRMVGEMVSKYRADGYHIEHIRRGTRDGYKAGALKYAMKSTSTEYVAIFDADFMPPKWFLREAIGHFSSPEIGMIQCRWGHANEEYSTITKAQALSLDFHFLIEQRAKSNSHLFMNFNGTAGIWRRECIEDAGGWHTATLVEDLDLSYRAQMRGWKCIFLPDMVVNAEIPVQMNGAKRQQFRWAKGSIQCALKLLPYIFTRRSIPAETKIQAGIQLTRHVVFPLMLVQFLTLPILLSMGSVNLYITSLVPSLTLAAYFATGPGAYLIIMQKMYRNLWKEKAKILPSLLLYSFGMAVNNTVAVFDAVFGKKNEFLRTPKYGIVKNTDDWKDKAYNLPFTKTTLLEIFFGIFGIIGIFTAIFTGNVVFAPIIALQTAGFFFIAYLSLAHSRFKRNKSSSAKVPTREEIMEKRFYKMAVIGIVAIILLGAFLAFDGYARSIYPLELAKGHLAEITRSTDLAAILEDLHAVKTYVPEEGNPVWIFQTTDTDFGIMQQQVESMIRTVGAISSSSADESLYHIGMGNIKSSALEMRKGITDAIPYMYVSISNIIFGTIWVAAIIGIFAVLKRKRERIYEEFHG